MRVLFVDCEWHPYRRTKSILIVVLADDAIIYFNDFEVFFSYANTEITTIIGFNFSAWRNDGKRIGDVNRYLDVYRLHIPYETEAVGDENWYKYERLPGHPNIYFFDVALWLVKQYPNVSHGRRRSLNFWCHHFGFGTKDKVTLRELADYFQSPSSVEVVEKVRNYCLKDTQLVRQLYYRIAK